MNAINAWVHWGVRAARGGSMAAGGACDGMKWLAGRCGGKLMQLGSLGWKIRGFEDGTGEPSHTALRAANVCVVCLRGLS